MAYRRPKSLRDLLVRAKLKPDMRDDEPLGETRPCGKARCKTCKMITPTQIAKSASGATIKLRCNTCCKTTNVVYLITCTKCGKQYVGEIGEHVNQRMNGHRDDWKHKRFERSPVAEHFCSSEHDFLSHATHCCLDHNPEWTDRTRKARESYWIRRLNTLRDQQGRPVEGIIVPKSGHATAYVHVLFIWFYVSWAHLPRLLVRKTQFGVYPFQCKVYAHCIHCVYGHNGVDSKDKLYTFCTLCLRVLFTVHIYIYTLSVIKSQRAEQHGPEKGIISFST